MRKSPILEKSINRSPLSKIKRKIGAQPGHQQHLRTPIAPELLDEIVKLELTNCPDCQQQLDLVDSETKTFQQITLVEKPIVVTEYQQLMYWCKNCRCYHYARLPEAVEKAGLFGEDMIALTAYLKGRSHMSYRTLQAYFHDIIVTFISLPTHVQFGTKRLANISQYGGYDTRSIIHRINSGFTLCSRRGATKLVTPC